MRTLLEIVDTSVLANWKLNYQQQGFFIIPFNQVEKCIGDNTFDNLNKTVHLLVASGLPPHEITASEDVWYTNHIIAPLVSLAVGGLVPNNDWFTYHNETTISQHDNRFATDMHTRNVTMWIGLSQQARGWVFVKNPRVAYIPPHFLTGTALVQTLADPVKQRYRLTRSFAMPMEGTRTALTCGNAILRMGRNKTVVREQWNKWVALFENNKNTGLSEKFVAVVERAIFLRKYK